MIFAHSNNFDRTPGWVSKMVSDLGLEPLQKMRQFDRLTTLYKIQRGLVERSSLRKKNKKKYMPILLYKGLTGKNSSPIEDLIIYPVLEEITTQ